MSRLLLLIFFTSLTQQLFASDSSCFKDKEELRKNILPGKSKKIFTDEYFQLPISQFDDASKYDYFVFDINSNLSQKESYQLIFTIQDNLSKNYWTQLNHIVEVQNGRQKVYVDLKQFVGERGSSKKARKVNYKNLKKIFLVLDPEKKGRDQVEVSNFHLLRSYRPKYPMHIKVFDFRIKDHQDLPCVQAVDDRDAYDRKKGYGFKELSMWRKEDSQYLDPFLSSVVFANSGEFAVDLENGEYELTLFWNSLGYWEPPFFKYRKVLAEDIPLRIHDRTKIEAYEKSYFIFENREPQVQDHPWDWLYNDIMRPITKKVIVKDGQLNLKFSGDASAVGLNGLIIARSNEDKYTKENTKFYGDFKKYLRNLYSKKVRSSYIDEKKWEARKPIVNLSGHIRPISPFLDLSKEKSKLNKIVWAKNQSTFVNVRLQVPFTGKTIIRWISQKSNSIARIRQYKAKYQWVSLDRNHESYTLETHYLKKNDDYTQGKINQQFIVEFSSENILKDRLVTEKGILQIQVQREGKDSDVVFKYPLEITVYNRDLPEPDIKVGFIGLNALRYSFYDNEERLSKRRFWDKKYLDLINQYGFNTFSGLPTDYGNYRGLSFEEVEKFITEAKKLGFSPPYYSYGGEFLHNFFEQNNLEGILNQKNTVNEFLKHIPDSEIIFQFSDEAAGYSDNVDRDLKRAKFLKSNFPRLRLGGFSHWDDKASNGLVELNKTFDVISLSKVGFSGLSWLQKNEKSWGFYNQAQGGRESPYLIFGRKLWRWSRKRGFDHYLEWHNAAIANLPYFDLDGREADVAIGLPAQNGELNLTLKYIQAAEGLQDFRWLLASDKKASNEMKKILDVEEKYKFRTHLLKFLD
jgi:hypothetical protein